MRACPAMTSHRALVRHATNRDQSLTRDLARRAIPRARAVALALGVGVIALQACLRSPAAPSAADGKLGVAFTVQQIPQRGEAFFSLAIPSWAEGNGPLVLSLSGAISRTDTFPMPSNPKGTPVLGAFTPPAGTPDGAVILTASMPVFGTSASASIDVKDNVPPVLVSDTLSGSAGGHTFHYLASDPHLTLIAGTTDTVTLTVTDNHQLHSAGYTIQGASSFGDSTVLSGDSTALTIPLVVPTTFTGDSALFTTFVSDADGNRQTSTTTLHIVTPTGQAARVRSAPTRPSHIEQTRLDSRFPESNPVIRIIGAARR